MLAFVFVNLLRIRNKQLTESVMVNTCSNIGLSGAQIHTMKTDKGFEVRQAVAFFGSFQMEMTDLEAIDFNPFHEDFHDNYISGVGETLEEALEELAADAKAMTNSLWLDH